MRGLYQYQKGMATILVTVVILAVITIMVLFAARVGVFDQRMAANEARYKAAFAVAEAGLNMAGERFESEFKRLYDGTNSTTSAATLTTILTNSQFATKTKIDGTAAAATEAGFTAMVVDSGSTFNSIPIFTVTATGIGADGTGTATVQRQFTMAHAFGGDVPDVPVIVGGAVGTGGNFNIVANPNSGGSGVPVSVWSNNTITASSSSATCHLQYYDGNNAQCSNPSGNTENISRGTNPASAIATYDNSYPDLLPNDPNFPSDLFNFMFGIPSTNWASKYAEAASNGQVVSDCSSIVNAGTAAGVNHPLWWVTGNCSISNGTIGTTSDPVIIIVDDHEFSVSGNSVINGIIYLFNNPDDPYVSSTSPTASMSGTTEIIGSFVSDVGGAAMSGSYSVVYDETLTSAFLANGNNFSFAWVPASWRDF